MPTGHTINVQNGTIKTGKDFILKCARSFGAMSHLRNKPLDTEIKLQKENDYYKEELEKIENEYNKYLLKSNEEIEKEIDEKYSKFIIEEEKRYKNYLLTKERYMNMLCEVQNWNPPTEDHKKLKTFCLKQLESSLKYDCLTMREFYEKKTKRPTLEEYKNKVYEDYIYYSNYYKEEIEKDQKRIKENNEWIKKLIESL